MNIDRHVCIIHIFPRLAQWTVAIQFLGLWLTFPVHASLDAPSTSINQRSEESLVALDGHIDWSHREYDAVGLSRTIHALPRVRNGPDTEGNRNGSTDLYRWTSSESILEVESFLIPPRVLATFAAAMLCIVLLVAWKKGWFIPKQSLHKAAKLGRIEDAARLAERGALVSTMDDEGHSPMYYAARAGHYGMVKLLRDAGASPNLSDAPLVQAISNGHSKVARMLLLNGARPNVKGPGGETPLIAAARCSDSDMITLLLDRQANVYEKDNRGWTALFTAIDSRDAGTVSRLIEAGSRADATALDGTTPLMLAVSLIEEDIVRVLVKAGADPNASTHSGSSPVSEAILQDNPRMMKMLLDAGADLSKDVAAFVSTEGGGSNKNDVDSTTEKLSPYDLAVRHGHSKVAALIKKRLARKGDTTGDILGAIHKNEYDQVKEMLNKKPHRVHRLSKDSGWGVLHLAVKNRNPRMVKLLLRHGAKVDQKNRRGKTPLHQAAELGNVAIIGLLLRGGANPLETYKKALPSDRAIERGHMEAARIIKSYMRDKKT